LGEASKFSNERFSLIFSSISSFTGGDWKIESEILSDDISTIFYSGPSETAMILRHYTELGRITLTIECCKESGFFPTYQEVESVKETIKEKLKALEATSCPAIKRCFAESEGTSPVMWTSDDRLLEFKWEKLLFSEKTPYQLVEIFETKDFGATLFLDGMINYAESDIAYTKGLMGNGKINYKGKNVLILGGGDGALLHELQQLDQPPNFVTMVDIDEAVMRGCRQYMRSACGDVLDTLETERYKIIVDDAFKWLDIFAQEERQFDIIFADLTDVPVQDGEQETWDFVRSILMKAIQLIPTGGTYITHAIGACAEEPLKRFDELVKSVGVPLEVKTDSAVVPSFHEKWIFYQLLRL